MREFISEPNFRTLLLVDSLLVVLLLMMSNYTSLLRLSRKVYATPEDYRLNRLTPSATVDGSVERSRRIHQNHLETVLPFLLASVLYAFTRPSPFAFRGFLWGFLAARVTYTVCYARSLQPHRTIAYTLGALITLAMSCLTLYGAFSG